MNTQIMLDLETLGNKPGAVIVAIGAVKFGDGEIHETFYQRIDAQSCVDIGLRMDASTVLWWMKQNDAAREEITKPGIHIGVALTLFAHWVDSPAAQIWGNGASFDNAILAEAYDAARIRRPWKYWDDRCYRTMKNQFPLVPFRRSGTHHNALDDARSQAEHLMEILEDLKAWCIDPEP